MGLRINQNIMAFSAYRNLSVTDGQLGKSLEKLSSGFRINRAADDAAGLVISEGLRSQVNGLKVAVRNTQDGISVVQTAEGALNEVHAMLQRMRDLAVQAANTGSLDANARAAAQSEVVALRSELDRIATSTKFGNLNLLDGSFGGGNVAASLTGSAVASATLRVDQSGVGADKAFMLQVDGGAFRTVDVATDASGYANSQVGANAYAADLQAAIDTALGAGGVVTATVTHNAGNWTVALDRTSTAAGTSIAVASAPGNTGYSDLALDGGLGGTGRSSAVTLGGGTFQVGANSTDTINVSIGAISSAALLINAIDVSSNASGAITAIEGAITSVSNERASLGATQNRFEHTIANLNVATENLAASESRIRDTDMALEMVSFTRHQILLQAGTAMLAQANVAPQSVLKLLG